MLTLISSLIYSVHNVYVWKMCEDEGIRLLNEKLTITDWSEVFNTYDTTAAYDVFIAKLTMLYEEIFPLTKTKKKNIRKPWITPSLLRCINKKHKLYKRFLRNRTSNLR